MRALLLFAAVLALAFAPAPLPRRPGRAGDDTALSLALLQGSWTITKLESTTPTGLVDRGTSLKEVRVERDRWSFVYPAANQAPATYALAVDGGRRPAILDLMIIGQQKPYGMGLLVRQGDEVKVLYGFNGQRPATFAPPPGFILMTLRRQR